jgi:hypothetical protein
MDRNRSIKVIKRVFEGCSHLEGKSLKLISPKNSPLSKGYQIHINGDDDIFCNHIFDIVDKEGLVVIRQGKLLIIYDPK